MVQSGRGTTTALPPPRRTGSAAASTRPWPRNSSPVAAPISGLVVNFCPYAPAAPAATGDARNAGSASPAPVLWLRCDARGAAIASGSE